MFFDSLADVRWGDVITSLLNVIIQILITFFLGGDASQFLS